MIQLYVAILLSAALTAVPAAAAAAEKPPKDSAKETAEAPDLETSSLPPPATLPPVTGGVTSGRRRPAPTGATAVLDFEADVIEGERKSPHLFLQLESETPNLDSLLYQRSTFNDFHNLEKTRRPAYRKGAP